MASKSSALLLIVFIEMLVSLGLANAQIFFPPPMVPGIPRIPGVPTIPGIPGVPTIPGIPEIQKCWASIINIEGCYAEIFRAFQNGQVDFTVGPTCCKAVKDLSSTCLPRMFPYNPFFPPLLQSYCSRYLNPVPATPPTPDVPPVAPVAPAPEENEPVPSVAPAPEDDAPVALAPEADAPVAPVAPAPEADAPVSTVAPAPEADAPVAPTPEADAPTLEIGA